MGVKVGNNKTKVNNSSNKKSPQQHKKRKESFFSGPPAPIKVTLPGYNNQLSTAAKTYKAALLEPFSDAAIGCRVPDQYFCPTVTYAVREFITVKVDSSGNFDCVLCPNPCFVAYSSRNSIANGTSMTMKNGSTYPNAQYTNPTSSLANKLSSYRVVSWGVRVRQTQSINVTQGTLTAALFVPKDGILHPSAGTSSAPIGSQTATGANWSGQTLADYIRDAGLPLDAANQVIDLGSLVDFPYHMRASCVNAAENTYEISPKVCSPTAFHFRDTTDSVFGTDITGQSSVSYIQPGDSSYLLLDGWTNVVIGGTGLVANSTGAVDLEIIYNIEGNPFISIGSSTGTYGSAIAVATGVKSICDPIGALLAQASLDTAPGFKLLNLARAGFRAFSGGD